MGGAVYISHLDIQRAFQRAFRRAALELEYTEGYNPHEKLSYSPPLPLFVSSDDEYIDLELSGAETAQEVYGKLTGQLPRGLILNGVRKLLITEKPLSKTFVWADYEITARVANPAEAAERINEFVLGAQEIITTKKTKSQKEARVDIRPLLCEFEAAEEQGLLVIRSFLSMANEMLLNPFTFIKAIEENVPLEGGYYIEKIHKLKAYL